MGSWFQDTQRADEPGIFKGLWVPGFTQCPPSADAASGRVDCEILLRRVYGGSILPFYELIILS